MCRCALACRHEKRNFTKGETFTNELVTERVKNTLQAVGLTVRHACTGFVTSSGNVIIIEVNPASLAVCPLTLMSGADTVGEYVRRIRGVPFNLENLTPPGVRMSRYFSASYSSDGAMGWAGRRTEMMLPLNCYIPHPRYVTQGLEDIHHHTCHCDDATITVVKTLDDTSGVDCTG